MLPKACTSVQGEGWNASEKLCLEEMRLLQKKEGGSAVGGRQCGAVRGKQKSACGVPCTLAIGAGVGCTLLADQLVAQLREQDTSWLQIPIPYRNQSRLPRTIPKQTKPLVNRFHPVCDWRTRIHHQMLVPLVLSLRECPFAEITAPSCSHDAGPR